MSADYDFIVVGGGTSGSVLASRLANSPAKPSVLLLEAGGDNQDPSYLVPSDRFSLAFTHPDLNWGYETEPQTHLKGQRINYARGRGLGGSTAINFSAWIIGCDEDYNEWARLVKDVDYDWNNVKETYKKIENYHLDIPEQHREIIRPNEEDHGTDGPLHISYGDIHRKNVKDVFEAAEQCDMVVNPDINSGNPIGMGMGAATMYRGARTTASQAYLSVVPPNLTIRTHEVVAKVLLTDDSKSARGVVTTEGNEFYARRDVIISAGALNTPQLLLLSGIGPAKDLTLSGIDVLVDHPQVGRNLLDHSAAPITLLQQPGTNQWTCFTGQDTISAEDTSKLFMPSPMGWFQSQSVFQSAEFQDLPVDIRKHLEKPNIPAFEICTHAAIWPAKYGAAPAVDSYMTAVVLFMNPLSSGTVTLNSANPCDPPRLDPNILSHPFDQRVAIEAVKETMRFFEAPALQKHAVKMVSSPKSNSDEDIWEHIVSNVFTSWHMCGTARMGITKEQAVVDSAFKVFDISKLRVVDLSVCPLLPNNHTQSTAYLLGEIAAQKMIKEYGLEEKAP